LANSGRFARILSLCAFAAACSAPGTSPAALSATARSDAQPAQSSPPPASVRDVRRVQLLCLVASDGTAATTRLQRDLCTALRRLAGRGAPVPVEIAQLGDPAVLDPAALTLLLHASVERIGEAPVLALSLRSFRNGGPDTITLFGPAPRAVPAGDSNQIESALDAALNHVLPWRTAPRGARPID
jgi:hypothetical protein